MRSTFKLGLTIFIRANRRDSKFADIYLRLTIDGERSEISLNEKILSSEWDSNKQQVKGRSLEIHSINTHIENVKAEMRQKLRNLIDRGALLTANILRDDYLNVEVTLERVITFTFLLFHYNINPRKWNCHSG